MSKELEVDTAERKAYLVTFFEVSRHHGCWFVEFEIFGIELGVQFNELRVDFLPTSYESVLSWNTPSSARPITNLRSAPKSMIFATRGNRTDVLHLPCPFDFSWNFHLCRWLRGCQHLVQRAIEYFYNLQIGVGFTNWLPALNDARTRRTFENCILTVAD